MVTFFVIHPTHRQHGEENFEWVVYIKKKKDRVASKRKLKRTMDKNM